MNRLRKILLALTVLSLSAFAQINLNTATKEELMSLKGIGSSKAEAIIEYRKINKFNSIEDLKNVKGIGDKIYDNLKDDISVSGKSGIKDAIKNSEDKATENTKKSKDNLDGKTKSAKDKLNSESKDMKEGKEKVKQSKDKTKEKVSKSKEDVDDKINNKVSKSKKSVEDKAKDVKEIKKDSK